MRTSLGCVLIVVALGAFFGAGTDGRSTPAAVSPLVGVWKGDVVRIRDGTIVGRNVLTLRIASARVGVMFKGELSRGPACTVPFRIAKRIAPRAWGVGIRRTLSGEGVNCILAGFSDAHTRDAFKFVLLDNRRLRVTGLSRRVRVQATLVRRQSMAPPPPAVIAAAGDLCDSWTNCAATANLLDTINPAGVLTLGDNAYPSGTLSEFNNYYRPHWGRHDTKVYPSPGNHEYATAKAQGYFDYFGARAPAPYYSYNLGSWHLISLNSEIAVGVGSVQERWLKADLAAHPVKCVLAYWHQPRFSSGPHGSNTRYGPLWNVLYAARAEIVLNGHDHIYERFALQNPSGSADPQGVRQFIVGTGGAGLHSLGAPIANSEVRQNTTYGVLKLTLRTGGYDWTFVPAGSRTFTDSGSGACR